MRATVKTTIPHRPARAPRLHLCFQSAVGAPQVSPRKNPERRRCGTPSPANSTHPPRYRNLWTTVLTALVYFPRLVLRLASARLPKIPNLLLLFSELLRIRAGIQNGRGNLNDSAFRAVDGVEMPCLPKKDVSIGADRASISVGVTIFLMSAFDSYGRPLRLLRPPS